MYYLISFSIFVLVSLAGTTVSGFTLTQHDNRPFVACHVATLSARPIGAKVQTTHIRMMSDDNDDDDATQQEDDTDVNQRLLLDRRSALSKAVAVAGIACSMSLGNLPVSAQEASSAGIGTDPDHPIVLIGAGGRVGSIMTRILDKKKLYTRAVTRSGKSVLSSPSSYVTYGAGDVTKYDSIKEAINGASGVIFAASASGKKKGGDPAHVDYLGLYNTAKACLECDVPKLVVISAGSVTRPDFVGFKATNLFVKYVYGDKIMDNKMAGEAAMRDLYSASSKSPPLSYAVIRPGGLSDKPAIGPSKLHISQGDVYSAEVSREDVAEVTVATLLKGPATNFVTMELNNAEGLIKVFDDLPDAPKELVHTGASTYGGLLDGLLTDSEMRKSHKEYMNDFRGSGVEPLESLV